MKKLLLFILLTTFTVNAQFWTEKASSFAAASRGINSISIVDDNVIWVKAYDGSAAAVETLKEYAKSTDGGNNWTSSTITLTGGAATLGISCITAVDANTAWVSAYPTATASGGIWKTVNGGTTWIKQLTALFSNASAFANVVHFWDANNGVCQGDPTGGYFEIYTTTNGGTTWTRVPSANIPLPADSGEYGYVHNYHVVGDVIWFGTNYGRIYRSADKGLNWTVSQSPINDFGGASESGSYTFSTATKGLLSSNSGQLWSTTDGGENWTPQAFSGPFYLSDLAYVPGTSNVICTGSATGNSGSSYSLDDGVTWTQIDNNVQHTFCEFRNSTIGFSGGFSENATSKGIFKYTGTVLALPTTEKAVFSVYPNPATDFITVNGASASIKAIQVVDINGRIVKSLKFDGITETQVNISDLNAGVYVITVSSEEGVSSTKIIKN
ncbi:T9SS type A sorting domain-containing protein [Flavobacterium sp.]|uniref:T9SS type A sorting domain-containing protein n=1 Tax=Flavobacterium sp. TaxID=239 RepID=UPI0025BE135A|nr:T9SS type A sorting domain-containing protein [Flavobacterium sp.]MBA4154842.1 glycosyl transferase [Flavobacterium sp.]